MQFASDQYWIKNYVTIFWKSFRFTEDLIYQYCIAVKRIYRNIIPVFAILSKPDKFIVFPNFINLQQTFRGFAIIFYY